MPERPAETFQRVRARTHRLFSLIRPEAYYARPIPLRHPIVFYAGHLDAFNWQLLFDGALGQASVQPTFDRLFARGIDPADRTAVGAVPDWPSRAQVQRYAGAIERRFRQYLQPDSGDSPGSDQPGETLIHLLLEHELMHQETLLYLIHQLPHDLKCPPDHLPAPDLSPAPPPSTVTVPAGSARLGAAAGEYPFVWDNELPGHDEAVPAFAMDVHNVTNGEFLAFVETGGYRRREFWTEATWHWRQTGNVSHPTFWHQQHGEWSLRDLLTDLPLPMSWPVYVTYAEADAYARAAGKRLPSEAEWHRAAYGDTQTRRYPWGDAESGRCGNTDFHRWSCTPVGSNGAVSPVGIHDLVGNGWEWTATPFAPFAGFRADPRYPGYSADFFDGQHLLLKGGSCFTDRRLLRRSFRNWFYWHYPYHYATFRTVA
ncbi:MAG: ergothioneine biosynthesis protein EgtB [Candidatus Sericytochromatia bacterium]|nr:ergothioneine biosynthesis protein EgtB [Candidatus Sericytochromatia bacterium]